MASVTNNSKKYGEGHSIILKKSAPSVAVQLMTSNGYTMNKSTFTITLSPKNVSKVISFPSGKAELYLIDDNKKVILITGNTGRRGIDVLFNHNSANAKSNTNLLTEIKENISMWVFQAHYENRKLLTEDDIIKMLGKNDQYYRTTYYESAVKQLAELKKHVRSGGYDYERQSGNLTKRMYKLARELTGKHPDNWNPADVWMIRKGFDLTPINKAQNFENLNQLIAEAFYKNKDIVPISLKNVTTPQASSSINDPTVLLNKNVGLDLSFDKVDLSNTFNNFIIGSKSGFQLRVGYKTHTLGVYIEGRMKGAGYQLGAVDAGDYKKEVKSIHKYDLRSGDINSLETDIEKAKQELKEIFRVTSRVSYTIQDYDDAMRLVDSGDTLVQSRFANLISYLYSYLILPESFESHMKFCYFSSKKITNKSALYLILQ
tara:strand:+ start:1421 stop:2713 length:1293 start_codon:yes stop_codon:yes gene_type:complete